MGVSMESVMRLKSLLSDAGQSQGSRLTIFAVINLGIIESLFNGSLSATDAVIMLFNADNCLYVRKQLKSKIADKIMSHGVQLPDLFEILPLEESQRQFLHELGVMRSLCFQLIDENRLAA